MLVSREETTKEEKKDDFEGVLAFDEFWVDDISQPSQRTPPRSGTITIPRTDPTKLTGPK